MKSMDTAPKDGTMVKLFVDYSKGSNPLLDHKQAWTIGMNNFDKDEYDEWVFAGWDWEQDCFTDGSGTPIGWDDLNFG